jgi:hypothetical protein
VRRYVPCSTRDFRGYRRDGTGIEKARSNLCRDTFFAAVQSMRGENALPKKVLSFSEFPKNEDGIFLLFPFGERRFFIRTA